MYNKLINKMKDYLTTLNIEEYKKYKINNIFNKYLLEQQKNL